MKTQKTELELDGNGRTTLRWLALGTAEVFAAFFKAMAFCLRTYFATK